MRTRGKRLRLTPLLLLLLSSHLRAQHLPAGTTLEVRLSTAVGSRISHVGDEIAGVTIAPVTSAGEILVPDGSRVSGSVESLQRLGFGLKQTTARIQFHFYSIRLLNGDTIPIHADLLEVETAKERVDAGGAASGIHPAASLSSTVSLFTTPLLFFAPAIGAPIWVAKSLIAPPANPEIYFPAGTEMILKLTAATEVPWRAERPAGITSFSPEELRQDQYLLNASAQHARLGARRSDLVNFLCFGSPEEISHAFYAAGWVQAERKSVMSLYRMYHALTERMGYKKAPMNALTLNGARPDFLYQKGLDTVQKRHHVRLWKDPGNPNVWLGAAAEDIGFRFNLTHWTHATAPDIDKERAKVVNDLAFTECLDGAGLLARHSPDLLHESGVERPILTDTNVAVVRLNACTSPTMMPGIDTASAAHDPSRLMHSLIWLRNDLRLNLFFTTYNTLKAVATHQAASTPLKKTPTVADNPPGLDWLSSLPANTAASASTVN